MQAVGGVVIAVAGMGSRLGRGMPKCLIHVQGRSILDRAIELVSQFTDTVHVVVGYREDLVIEYCALEHPNVVLVRNPDYRTTSTSDSFVMGARGLQGAVVYMDGDLIFEPGSFARLIDDAVEGQTLVGVVPARSEDPVYVDTQGGGTGAGGVVVTGFRRDGGLPYEWANVLVACPDTITPGTKFVYESLTPLLPLPACVLDVVEVDTEGDFRAAEQIVGMWDVAGGGT